MISPLLRRVSRAGFTLTEMMVSVSVGGFIVGAMILGTSAFQGLFFAEDDYYQSTADQMRVLDYIARDVRNAISGTVSNNGATLTVLLPDYIDPATNLPRTPTLTAGPLKSAANVSYQANASDSVNVTYAVSGNSVTRTQVAVRSGVTTTTQVVIASNVDSLQLTDASSGGSTNFTFAPANSGISGAVQSVKTTLTFMPRFTRSNLLSSRSGTTLSQTVVVRGN
jgi:prepilin-type N-terminal cleavage/methylation domain-containing protein